jgi:hypothetical protein
MKYKIGNIVEWSCDNKLCSELNNKCLHVSLIIGYKVMAYGRDVYYVMLTPTIKRNIVGHSNSKIYSDWHCDKSYTGQYYICTNELSIIKSRKTKCWCYL